MKQPKTQSSMTKNIIPGADSYLLKISDGSQTVFVSGNSYQEIAGKFGVTQKVTNSDSLINEVNKTLQEGNSPFRASKSSQSELAKVFIVSDSDSNKPTIV